mmetsp:Transcript_21257/g.39143  ORF Transcript_21257/g.39143 Transcript_21257/m.39143 type:complete len:88 (+) Transcript_21257:384-647(+)
MEECSCGANLTYIGAFCKACIYSQIDSLKLSNQRTLHLKASLQEGNLCLKCFKLKLTKLKMSESGDDLVFTCPKCKSVEATVSSSDL